MPPYVPRKRVRTPSPQPSAAKSAKTSARKTTVFEDLEATSKTRSAEKTKSAIQRMQDDDDDDSSSLSSLSEVDFEDVPAPKRQKVASSPQQRRNQGAVASDEDTEEEDEDEDVEFEDVPNHIESSDKIGSGEIEIELYNGPRIPLASEIGKKGLTKKEKAMRQMTHNMHVQLLMWHNAVRNSWLSDPEVQAMLISHLPPRLWDELDRWKRASGLEVPEDAPKKPTPREKGQSRAATKGKQKRRDWSEAADRLEKGVADMSHGDPINRLMTALRTWWKQKFTITAPGLRKWGYMSVRRAAKLTASLEKSEHDPNIHGERIQGLEEFRTLAQGCYGSRDVGAQLFTALLRGLGLEARMVASLQPLGFGWSKIEEADEEKAGNSEVPAGSTSKTASNKSSSKPARKTKPARPASRRVRKQDEDALAMDLDDSDEYAEPVTDVSDEDSIVDVTDTFRPKPPKPKPYDKDLEWPVYWTEVLSPVTHKYTPVDAIVKAIVGSSRELVESFEPRGAKAEKAKQGISYCIAHSQDGTAKDVTVRYLKGQLFPGKAKGNRMQQEKIPVYNKHGKLKRYEYHDYFKAIMRGYVRGGPKHPITEIDEAEESTDLKPAKPEKKEVKEGEETLQYYKSSKEFVLERHLKREEALLPGTMPVKKFRNKGKGGKMEAEEDVFLRKDIVAVKSAETWHKQGRAPLPGVTPLKHAPYRVATTNRRRELAEAEAAAGHKILQPLYSHDQTDWIIPDPIKDGVIPKNEYGNIDMFAEHMCPEGAVHIPYRGVVRVCKRMGIDFAEAVVGFEFGHRMAVPVIQGVVVAEEHHDKVIEELEKDEAERARKEDEKKRKAVLTMWRKLLMGLRVADRIREDYAHLEEDEGTASQTHQNKDWRAQMEEAEDEMRFRDEEMAGGFLPEGYNVEEPAKPPPKPTTKSAYFADSHGDDEDEADPFEIDHGAGNEKLEPGGFVPFDDTEDAGGGFIPDEEDTKQEEEYQDPEPPETKGNVNRRRCTRASGSLKKAAPKAKAKPKQKQDTRRRSRRTKVEDTEDEEDSEDEDDDEEFLLDDSD